jgi:hypothetical protein
MPRSGLLGDASSLCPSAITATDRMIRIASRTPHRLDCPFKLAEESHTICGGNKRNTRPQCGFRFFNGTTVYSSALSMKHTSSAQ